MSSDTRLVRDAADAHAPRLVILCMAAAVLVTLCWSIGRRPVEPMTPIIAELLSTPASYDGRTVRIYGLVVGIEQAGRVFELQDVSQRPLRVVRDDGLPTLAGDQLLIEGVFVAQGVPHLRATGVSAAKVLGGGGCC